MTSTDSPHSIHDTVRRLHYFTNARPFIALNQATQPWGNSQLFTAFKDPIDHAGSSFF